MNLDLIHISESTFIFNLKLSIMNQTAINLAYNQLSNIKSGAAQIFQSITSNWSTIVNQQDAVNNNVNASESYVIQQKMANKLWLKSMSSGIQSINDSQMTFLANLAYQCPLKTDQGVITARAILINPASSWVNILPLAGTIQSEGEIDIINSTGTHILTQTIDQTGSIIELDISSWPIGMYVMLYKQRAVSCCRARSL